MAIAALLPPNPTASFMNLLTGLCWGLPMTKFMSGSTGFSKLATCGTTECSIDLRLRATSAAPEAKFKCPKLPLKAVMLVFLRFLLS